MGVRDLYQQTLRDKGFAADPAQLAAVDALERCEGEWATYLSRRRNAVTRLLNKPPIPRGVYMYGGVGRGKSFLMDSFFQVVPLQRKTRLHFHEFMREVHRELQDLRGIQDPLDELGRRIAQRFRLRPELGQSNNNLAVQALAPVRLPCAVEAANLTSIALFLTIFQSRPGWRHPKRMAMQRTAPASQTIGAACR